MEEKERYIILSGRQIKDTQNQSQAFLDIETVCRLLNQQSKRIKELEEENKVGEFWHSAYQGKQLEYDQVYAELRKSYEENQQLNEQLSLKMEELHIAYCGIENVKTKNGNLKAEIKKLNLEAQKYYEDAYCNNFQNQKAIEELEKVKESAEKAKTDISLMLDYTTLIKIIDNQIKELRGGENE